MYDFRGRPLLSKPLNPASPTNPKWGGATQILAVIAMDKNGRPIQFGTGGSGGGTGDMSKAIMMKFDQPDVLDTWVITHNMNCYPAVRVDNGTGIAGIPDVDYTSKNELRVIMGTACSGSAYLSRYPNISLSDGQGGLAPADLDFSDSNNLKVDLSPEKFPPDSPGIVNVDYEE